MIQKNPHFYVNNYSIFCQYERGILIYSFVFCVREISLNYVRENAMLNMTFVILWRNNMRLFIAIQFSDDIKKGLISVMHDLKKKNVGGSYSPADNLHLTLAFIGETQNVEGVKRAMEATTFAPFMLSLTDLGNFGDILWVGAKGGQKLKAYVKALGGQLDAAGIKYDKKKFEPHITLVRRASNARPQGITVLKKDMMVKKISLMKSEQKNGRMVYTEIFHVGS